MTKLHPMYKDPKSFPARERSWLRQGDIIGLDQLIKSGALDGHQEYIKQRPEFFCGFCVITQTCDLVRETPENARNKKKPRQPVEFIALSMIRHLTDVFNKNDVSNSERKTSTRSILKSITNHEWNKQRPYFYLHNEASGKIEDDWVVDLRTFFSLVSDYHYDQILGARLLCLNEVYANKLGWMAGHMFSRVATNEWDDFEENRQTQDKFLDRILERIAGKEPQQIHNVRAEVVNRLKKLSSLTSLSDDQLDALLERASQEYGSRAAR